MYSIKEAAIADTDAIISIATETYWSVYGPILTEEQINYMLGTIYSVETISGQIENNVQSFLLLLEDEEPVAFAAYSPRAENPDIYKLHKLYCLPKTQGKGYGKVLLNAVADKVKEAGKNTLDLNVNRYNNAKTFYEKMGFKAIYEEDIPVGDYWMNDFVMRKEL
ncbi:GNAT family N-acetyltransferase [Mucilaginibacter sp. ZT4R22]|uniref:GNAT family N-acetyltransferase n=1 Tax=Mucilaginibacter pankratovii TaxID=2772110 RepID=A0ABR7WMQ8_9SPHI|nr:GNAT family N-acetyltransferase [Mucilaginibacter pankratovii]MBD1363590.1 GNAT family N-acetyltransferase [Mucilaginibacter pankratovii]